MPLTSDRITYNDELHRYYIDGQVAPSVTTVISNKTRDYDFGGGKGCIPSFMTNMKAAATFGQKVHDLTHEYDTGLLSAADIELLDDKTKNHMYGYLHFLDHNKLRVATIEDQVMSEILIFSLKRRYCGRFDKLCIDVKDRLVMVDLKCTAEIPKTVGLQTAGYTHAWHEMMPKHKVARRMVCQLTGEGAYGYNQEDCKDKTDEAVFLCKLVSLQWDLAHEL